MARKHSKLLLLNKLLEKKVKTSLNHLEEFTRELAGTVDASQFDVLCITRVDDLTPYTRRFINDTQTPPVTDRKPQKSRRFALWSGKFKLN